MPTLLSGFLCLWPAGLGENYGSVRISLSIYPLGFSSGYMCLIMGGYLWLFLMFCLFPFAAFADLLCLVDFVHELF